MTQHRFRGRAHAREKGKKVLDFVRARNLEENDPLKSFVSGFVNASKMSVERGIAIVKVRTFALSGGDCGYSTTPPHPAGS